jgi:RNA polymerase sigma-70 factor (ECF subfamily)
MEAESRNDRLENLGGAAFRTTRWSVVVRAGQTEAAGSVEALEELCKGYWYPVYCFVRRCGRSALEAEDLVQGFFLKLLQKNYLAQADRERGKFRTFLLAAVKHFLANEQEHAEAKKRGGGIEFIALDAEELERKFSRETACEQTPEMLFEKRWAETILENSLRRLRFEFDGGGKVQRFDILKPFLLRQKEASYREASDKLGMSEAAVKSAIFRMRERFQTIFREEIGQTVVTTQEIDAEIRHLLEVLAA